MKWRLFVCSDCESGAVILRVPDDAPYEYGCSLDFCPACESHLSLLGRGDVEVTDEYGRRVE